MKNRVIRFIANFTNIDVKEVKTIDKLSDLGIDSLQMVELIIGLEDEMEIEFNYNDLNPAVLTDVQAIINLANQYKAKEE